MISYIVALALTLVPFGLLPSILTVAQARRLVKVGLDRVAGSANLIALTLQANTPTLDTFSVLILVKSLFATETTGC